MIFYFSGTGNSLQAAKNIAEYNDESLISIAAEMHKGTKVLEYELKENETIGFVFPVFAWAPPEMVINFIKRIKFNNYNNNYVFSVATCGSNVGGTMKCLDSALKKKSLSLSSAFSIAMPSNYITGGDVESEEAIERKLSAAEESLKKINEVIKNRKTGVMEVCVGSKSVLLTNVIGFLFNKAGRSTSKFYVTDNCTGCGLCESICSCNTIKVNGKPKWGSECSQCLGCINLCPAKAIQFGKYTSGKGRYKNPNIKLEEMKINIK